MIVKSFETNKIFSNNPAKFCLFYGPNVGLVNLLGDKYKTNFNGFETIYFEQEEIENNFSEIFDCLNEVSFLSQNKIVVINNGTDKIAKNIENLISLYNGDNVVVVKSTTLNTKSKLVNVFAKPSSNNIICVACYGENEKGLLKIVQDEINGHNLKISASNLKYIVSMVSDDTVVARMETNKICIYCLDKGTIEKTDIDNCIEASKNFTPNDLAYKILLGKRQFFTNNYSRIIRGQKEQINFFINLSDILQKAYLAKIMQEKGAMVDNVVKDKAINIFWTYQNDFKQILIFYDKVKILKAITKFNQITARMLNNDVGFDDNFIQKKCMEISLFIK